MLFINEQYCDRALSIRHDVRAIYHYSPLAYTPLSWKLSHVPSSIFSYCSSKQKFNGALFTLDCWLISFIVYSAFHEQQRKMSHYLSHRSNVFCSRRKIMSIMKKTTMIIIIIIIVVVVVLRRERKRTVLLIRLFYWLMHPKQITCIIACARVQYLMGWTILDLT